MTGKAKNDRLVCPVCRATNGREMASCYACGTALDPASKKRKAGGVRSGGAFDGRRPCGGGFRVVRSSKPES